jgi:hypothetical protein
MKLKTNKTFTKELRKKIKNKKNKNQIKKKIIFVKLELIYKIKTNITFIKGPRIKIKKNKE